MGLRRHNLKKAPPQALVSVLAAAMATALLLGQPAAGQSAEVVNSALNSSSTPAATPDPADEVHRKSASECDAVACDASLSAEDEADEDDSSGADNGQVLELPQVWSPALDEPDGSNGAATNSSSADGLQGGGVTSVSAANEPFEGLPGQVGDVQDYEKQGSEPPLGAVLYAPGPAIYAPSASVSWVPRPLAIRPLGVARPMRGGMMAASPIILPPTSAGSLPSTSPMLMPPRGVFARPFTAMRPGGWMPARR